MLDIVDEKWWGIAYSDFCTEFIAFIFNFR